MKIRLLGQGLTGLAIASMSALVATATINQPSYAGGTTFYCGKSRGVPVTFARTQDGKNVPMVRWVSGGYFPPPWTAQKRCLEVSRRFQKNYDNGRLRTIKTGLLRGEPVVCAATNPNNPCTDSTLLFTVKRGADPNVIVRRLFDRRGLAAGNALNESSNSTVNIDFDTYVQNAATDSSNDLIYEPNDNTSEAGVP
ncbi:COP23 domain-containing protein [Nostoc sp. TCL26-01]|uniref:COP23 domain-containing protein n=1 Tax=Nostoc sp. TCL26-01 TaxID=2576904 RepID=UPI0015BB3619|nr:COP23 domain-containing protein [Nostoc sp. TCL26-01]QLE56452.1 hypothetical protein FD725_13570 [Nostoc sp. TCL26-01]